MQQSVQNEQIRSVCLHIKMQPEDYQRMQQAQSWNENCVFMA